MWQKPGFLGLPPAPDAAGFAKNHTLMRTQRAATKLLDHIDGWQKVYADDIATIHVRKPDAVHTIEPRVDIKAK